jgi:hypothetical protein
MARRFITKQDVDDLADRGVLEVDVDRTVTVTDLAREHARSRGVRFVEVADAAPPTASPAGGASPPAAGAASAAGSAAAPSAGELRARVRAAVIAQLGGEPQGLDRIIDRVLGERARDGGA